MSIKIDHQKRTIVVNMSITSLNLLTKVNNLKLVTEINQTNNISNNVLQLFVQISAALKLSKSIWEKSIVLLNKNPQQPSGLLFNVESIVYLEK